MPRHRSRSRSYSPCRRSRTPPPRSRKRYDDEDRHRDSRSHHDRRSYNKSKGLRKNKEMASAVDASGDPIPTSAVLMTSSKHIGTRCHQENVAFLKCKKKDPNPEKCLNKGQQVTRCVLGLLKDLHQKCTKDMDAYVTNLICVAKSRKHLRKHALWNDYQMEVAMMCLQ